MKIQILLLALLPASLSAQQVSLFEREAGTPGNVVVLGTVETRPPALQGITLLPIECVGRSRLTQLMPESTRRRTDVPGAARLVLPLGRGSLYHYRRDALGEAVFGYFLVEPSGEARPLFELPGKGPNGTDDSLPGRVAISSDGSTLLFASAPSAGGDLYELDLATATAVNRTPHLPPLSVQRGGLGIYTTWGVALTDQGPLRFERAPGSLAAAVTLPTSVAWFGPDVVGCADESTVAFLAGSGPSRALVFAMRSSGAVRRVSQQAMPISGAGFLPEEPSGPTLALSSDGSTVAWRAEGSSRECYIRPTNPATPVREVHVTGPDRFDNTLNDTGVIAFFGTDSAVMVAGRQQSDGIGRADVYAIALKSTGLEVRNLTATSGILQPPFDYGSIGTADGLYLVPAAQPTLVGIDEGNRGRVLRFDTLGGTFVALDRVESLDSLDLVGNYLVATVKRPPGVDDPLRSSLNLAQIPCEGTETTLIRLPQGCRLTRRVASGSSDVFAAVLELGPAGEWLGRAHIPTTTGFSVTSALRTYGPTTSLSPGGTVLASIQAAARSVTFEWSFAGTFLLRTSSPESFLLPGL